MFLPSKISLGKCILETFFFNDVDRLLKSLLNLYPVGGGGGGFIVSTCVRLLRSHRQCCFLFYALEFFLATRHVGL